MGKGASSRRAHHRSPSLLRGMVGTPLGAFAPATLPTLRNAAVGYGAFAFALLASADTLDPPCAYTPSTVMTMSFSSVDCLRNAISG
ncbi:MAG: hypothetical protein QOJ86_63 [Bradyrhizobium sp.]|nr:hypothetical protein [Bradyrhizobium sp.]